MKRLWGRETTTVRIPEDNLGDYASVVAELIETFAQVASQDELTLYRSLVTADRDVIRIRGEPGGGGSP